MVTAIQTTNDEAQLMESVLLGGDLARLSPAQRVSYYQRVCESLGLNPLTKPFDFINLNGKLTLYARKDATEQLRKIHNVCIDDVDIVETEKQFVVKVKGHDKDGRTDVEVGVVNKTDMRGDTANVQMKAVTKAKRRLTLSLCGLGWLDETEVSTIPDAKSVIVNDGGEIVATVIEQPENINQENGQLEQAVELIDPHGSWAVDYAANHWSVDKSYAAQDLWKKIPDKSKAMDKRDFVKIVTGL